MSAATLRDALSAFDEPALELLANKGLVRRAARDLTDEKVSETGQDGETALIRADGETVRIDARGPHAANCTCPALGVCRHIIAAVLFIRASKGADAAEAPPVAAAFPMDELAALSTSAIRKWAGKAGWLGALDLLEQGVEVRDDGNALVTLVGEHEVRILAGQGLEGIVSKVKPALRKAVHSAAMLAARRLANIVEEEVDPAPAVEPDLTETKADAGFIADVHAALADCARLALNLAPVSLEERLFILSVSSKADALPRLGAMLRLLSAQVRSRRAREFTFDPDRCAELMGDVHALLIALNHAETTSDAPRRAALAGQARQAYQPVGTLGLYGFGADRWATTSGARGVTGYFYDPHGDRWLTAGLARAAGQDAMFDPRQAYDSEGLWGGPALSRLSCNQITLDDAALSSSGRLSLAQGVRVRVGEASVPDATWRSCLADWSQLRTRLHERLTGGIARERRALEPVILHPARVAKPVFDDLAQRLDWPIEDEAGQWIRLSLDHGKDRAGLLTALEQMAQRGWKGQIVALATVDGQRFGLRPIAVIEDGHITNLGLDPIKGQAPKARAGQFLRSVGALLSGMPSKFENFPQTLSRRALDAAWAALVEMAELGLGHYGGQAEARLPWHARNLSDCGLETVSRMLAALHDAPSDARIGAYLKALYALRLAQRQMIDVPWLVGIR